MKKGWPLSGGASAGSSERGVFACRRGAGAAAGSLLQTTGDVGIVGHISLAMGQRKLSSILRLQI